MVEILSGLDNGFPSLGTARMLCLENGRDTIPSPGARLRSGRDAVHAYGVAGMLCFSDGVSPFWTHLMMWVVIRLWSSWPSLTQVSGAFCGCRFYCS